MVTCFICKSQDNTIQSNVERSELREAIMKTNLGETVSIFDKDKELHGQTVSIFNNVKKDGND